MKSNYKLFPYSKFTNQPIVTMLFMVCFLFMSSCLYENKEDLYEPLVADPCMPETVSFAEIVFPIVESNCNTSGCHNSDDRAAGIDLGDYEGIFQSVESTRFYGVINHEDGFSPMPKGGAKLPACDISVIEIWIANGSQNN